jgi:periplasmic divalent cation tolerance protein
MSEHVQVISTTENRKDAERMAEFLVEKRLAACVQVFGPIASVYWWEGRIERANEWFCLIKTTGALYESLESAIRKIHPYKVPEILAIPVVAGSKDYLSWLDAAVEKTPE